MSSSMEERARAGSENEAGCRPRADVITGQTIHGDTLYLIRIREDWDTHQTFHLKKLSQCKELDVKLREFDKTVEPEKRVLTVIPDLPESGRFGIRRQLSKIGMSHFLDRQHEAIQNYLETLMGQIPNLAAEANLQAFFNEERDPEAEAKMKEMIIDCRSGINLKTLAGNWKPSGFDHTWTIEENGKALLDGIHRGSEYDLAESGEGLQMTIARLDGWKVDIEKSTTSHLFWYMSGQADLEWLRGEGFLEAAPAAPAGEASPAAAAA